MTAYASRRLNECGNTLTLKGDAGREVFEALRAEQEDIEAEFVASNPGAGVSWRRGQDRCSLIVRQVFAGKWQVEQEEAHLVWLLDATNAFVNAVRPRVLRLLSRGATNQAP
jgi:hypothetical protein